MIDFLKSKFFIAVITGLGILILFLSAFSLGVVVGQRKAGHMAGWYIRYGYPAADLRMRVRRPPPFIMTFPGGHAAFGRVVSLTDSSLVVQGKDGLEQTILVTSSTDIRLDRSQATLKDVGTESEVAVFGAPTSSGQIEAKLIRVLRLP